MEQPVPECHPETGQNKQKSPAPEGTGLRLATRVMDQPRVRERIMKLS